MGEGEQRLERGKWDNPHEFVLLSAAMASSGRLAFHNLAHGHRLSTFREICSQLVWTYNYNPVSSCRLNAPDVISWARPVFVPASLKEKYSLPENIVGKT